MNFDPCTFMAVHFRDDLATFTISGFLPGEYALRVFPLICKSMRSCRLSLSLLGFPPVPSSLPTEQSIASISSTPTFDLEGPIYGIYSVLRHLQRVIKLGHSINALTVDHLPLFAPLPSLRALYIPDYSRLRSLVSYPLLFSGFFPKLTKVEVRRIDRGTTVQVVQEVWELPLVSLLISELENNDDDEEIQIQPLTPDNSPAFAQTLRSLTLETSQKWLLALLCLYCHRLERIAIPSYHRILNANPALTSLTLTAYSEEDHPVVDLTQQTQLVELSMRGAGPFQSKAKHKHLLHVSLKNPDSQSARNFLQEQCPALQHLSLAHQWDDIIDITDVLDSTKCKQLTLSLPGSDLDPSYPVLYEVNKYILHQGFKINEEFLLQTADARLQCWKETMEIAPHIKQWKALKVIEALDAFIVHPACLAFFPLFNALSVIEFDVYIPWNQPQLSSIVQLCPVLKQLTISGEGFSGIVELQSQSLCKLDISFYNGFCGLFNLALPNLTHFTIYRLREGDGLLLSGLLNADSTIELPRLRSLDIQLIDNDESPDAPMAEIPCKTGHSSLTRLVVVGQNQHLTFSKLKLQNLPSLRQVVLSQLSQIAQVHLHVPGNCDIYLKDLLISSAYIRDECSDQTDFVATIHYNSHLERWVERAAGEEDEGEQQDQQDQQKQPRKHEEKKTRKKGRVPRKRRQGQRKGKTRGQRRGKGKRKSK